MAQPTMRRYTNDDDYWRIRTFLREAFRLNGYRQYSWDVLRFDYWRWHGVMNIETFPLQDAIFIWETADRQIAAVLNPEGMGDAFLQVHPDMGTPALEEEMIAVAEQHLVKHGAGGRRRLQVWAHAQDPLRQGILQQRGYARGGWPEYQRRRPVDVPIPEAPPAPGYSVRSLGDGVELLERCYASGLAFHENDIKIAVNNRNDVTWYRNIQTAPLYRRDFDVVAIAPDGAVASFCTVWFDDVTRAGVFEPVATVPAHQRRGLGRAVMAEGLRRLRKAGATMAYVGSYSAEAGALYASMGFTEYDLYEPWCKEW